MNTWRKSSYSPSGNNCVEMNLSTIRCLVRDSKQPAAGQLPFSRAAWDSFLDTVKPLAVTSP